MEADNERLDKRRFLLETAFSDSVLIFGVYILIEGSYQDRMLAMCRGYLGICGWCHVGFVFGFPGTKVPGPTRCSKPWRKWYWFWQLNLDDLMTYKRSKWSVSVVPQPSPFHQCQLIEVVMKTINKERPRIPKLGKTCKSNEFTVPPKIMFGFIGSLKGWSFLDDRWVIVHYKW